MNNWLGVLAAGTLLVATTAAAQEPSIDRLLKKLPPPEKLVKSPTQRALQTPDPVVRDPIFRNIVQALSSYDIPRSLNLSRQLVAKYPQNEAALCIRGAFALVMRQLGEAGASFHNAEVINPKEPLPPLGLGLVELERKNYAGALPHFRRLAELEPKAYGAWAILSECAEKLGRKAESVEYAKHATAVAPSVVGTWVQLARAEKGSGNTAGTLAAMTKAAELSPDSSEMLATVGYSYINLNRIPQAVAPLARAAQLNPNDFLVQSQLGFCLEVGGQTDAAVAHLRKGASLAPNYGPVWEHLGLAYGKQGRHREAIKAFERATKIMPSYKLCWQHLAEEYRAVGQGADAERAAARARALPTGRVPSANPRS